MSLGVSGGSGSLGRFGGVMVSKGMCVLGLASRGMDIGFGGSLGCLRSRGGGVGWVGVSRDNGRVWELRDGGQVLGRWRDVWKALSAQSRAPSGGMGVIAFRVY